jgi:hypothetical protein
MSDDFWWWLMLSYHPVTGLQSVMIKLWYQLGFSQVLNVAMILPTSVMISTCINPARCSVSRYFTYSFAMIWMKIYIELQSPGGSSVSYDKIMIPAWRFLRFFTVLSNETLSDIKRYRCCNKICRRYLLFDCQLLLFRDYFSEDSHLAMILCQIFSQLRFGDAVQWCALWSQPLLYGGSC